jgi:hypothetical protein
MNHLSPDVSIITPLLCHYISVHQVHAAMGTPCHLSPKLSWESCLGHPLPTWFCGGSLQRCWPCLPGVICAVVVGVLLGVGHIVVLLVETLLVFVKLKEKRNHKRDWEVSLLVPPSPSFLGLTHHCLGPALVVAVVPDVVVPHK